MAIKRGRVYQRGAVWWVQYYFNGQDRRESTHSTNKRDADKILTKRQAGKDAQTLREADIKPIKFEDLNAVIARDYRNNQLRSTDRMEDAFKALGGMFAGWKTNAITDTRLEEYLDQRLASGKAHATILYEFRMLRRAFRLAKLPIPCFPSITLNNTRTGFFERQDFEAVLTHLPAYLRPVMRFSYLTGWRTISEVLPLQWKQVDFISGTIRLEPGTTKNRDGRTFPFAALPELAALLQTQREHAQKAMTSRQCLCPWVFFRVTGKGIPAHQELYDRLGASLPRSGATGEAGP